MMRCCCKHLDLGINDLYAVTTRQTDACRIYILSKPSLELCPVYIILWDAETFHPLLLGAITNTTQLPHNR